jgi:HEAT repeat protein
MLRIVLITLLAAGLMSCQRSQPREDLEKRAAKLSDSELKSLVEQVFVQADPMRENYRTLSFAGDRAVPYLVKALDDPRTWSAEFRSEQPWLTGSSPFDRIADLLRSTAPAQAAKPLVRYLDHPKGWNRALAAIVIAKIGTPECLDPMKKALADPEEQVRKFAMGGIVEGIQKKRQSEVFLAGVFDALVPMLNEPHRYDWHGPAAVLAWIDTEKAAAILERPQYFTTRNPQLEDVLKALSLSNHKTPLAILMPLMKELAPAAANDDHRTREFAAALRLYAHNPDADAEATFRALVDAPNDRVAEGAAWALEDMAGVDTDHVIELGDKKFATLTAAQRYYYAVREYHDEVCNGGHDQFFRNPEGDHYQTAVEGLRAIGAKAKAEILEGSLRAFWPGKPSLDQTTRQDQVLSLASAGAAILRQADDRYFESEKKPGERVEVLLALYAVANRWEFGAPR